MMTEQIEAACETTLEERWILGERIYDEVAKQVDLTPLTREQTLDLLYQAAESGHHAPTALGDAFNWCEVRVLHGFALVAPNTDATRGAEALLVPGFLPPRSTRDGLAYFWPSDQVAEERSRRDCERRYNFTGYDDAWDDDWNAAYDQYVRRVCDDVTTVREIAGPLCRAIQMNMAMLFGLDEHDADERAQKIIRSTLVKQAEGANLPRVLLSAGRLIDHGIKPLAIVGMSSLDAKWLVSTR
jgi:hypothetical protein